MKKINSFSTAPMQHAVQYTVYISILYIVFKFFDQNSPTGKDFIFYIIPVLFSNIILIVFPLLFVFFYFKDGNAIQDIKNNLSNEHHCEMDTRETREELREYHAMMKEGIITKEEFDSIKKKYFNKLKDLK